MLTPEYKGKNTLFTHSWSYLKWLKKLVFLPCWATLVNLCVSAWISCYLSGHFENHNTQMTEEKQHSLKDLDILENAQHANPLISMFISESWACSDYPKECLQWLWWVCASIAINGITGAKWHCFFCPIWPTVHHSNLTDLTPANQTCLSIWETLVQPGGVQTPR